MALQEYIVIGDITNRTIKQAIDLITVQGGDLSEYQEYVDRANEYYEDLCVQLGVAREDIRFPIPSLCKEHIKEWLSWNYGKEHNGLVNSESGLGDTTYSYMEESAYAYYKDSRKNMTKSLVSENFEDGNRVSVSFGKLVK